MKKKFLIILLLIVFIVSGCSKSKNEDIILKIKQKIENLDSYYIEGNLELFNNEEQFKYNVKVGYKKNDNFKVLLKNNINNHEQIILRNQDGVYVLTPSLNKSFKFQSEWPYNNSQSYLLQTILKDIEDDKEKKINEKDNMYIITVKANYSNNKELIRQDIIVDKDYNIKEVMVYDDKGNIGIKMTFNKIEENKSFDDGYFKVENNMETEETFTSTTTKIENITYPLYIPSNTFLSNKEVIKLDNGERVILTFKGESPFMLIQETVSKEKEFITIPTLGEPCLFADTIGTMSDNSISWISNGIEYYVTSEVVGSEELLNVAKSIGAMPVATIK